MAHKIIDAIDEVKEKLTDNEYKNIVELVAKTYKVETEAQERLEFTAIQVRSIQSTLDESQQIFDRIDTTLAIHRANQARTQERMQKIQPIIHRYNRRRNITPANAE